MPVKASRSIVNAHFYLMMGLIVLQLLSKVGCQATEQTSNVPDLELDLPPHIADLLDCSSVNATICTDLASEYGHTYQHEDVCYPLSDQDGPTGQFAPCNLICSGYEEMDDIEKDYCDKRCPYYIANCEPEDLTTSAVTPQTQFPPQLWTDNQTCTATEDMCKSTVVPHNENFNMSCYQDKTNPNEPEYRPCQTICESELWSNRDACEYYCEEYTKRCETKEVTTYPSIVTPQTKFTPPPWTDSRTCDATGAMCKSVGVPHNENFNLSCYQDNTDPNEPEYRPCQPVCVSDFEKDRDACLHYCPGYLVACSVTTPSTTTSLAKSADGTGLPLIWKIVIPVIAIILLVIAVLVVLKICFYNKRRQWNLCYDKVMTTDGESRPEDDHPVAEAQV